ncbi:hypothetical protein EBZ37_01395, partial [bacterium]|nr:hypothetical protein [bacterium]
MIRLIGVSIISVLLAFPSSASEKKPTSPAQTASGPITPGEAEILWERAQELLAERNLDQAILNLERLVNRIPTHSRSLQAQRLLGELELERGQPEKALEWLGIAFNNLKGQGVGSSEIDLLRAQAYLLLQKGSEALLVAEKLLHEADAGKIRWGIDAQI